MLSSSRVPHETNHQDRWLGISSGREPKQIIRPFVPNPEQNCEPRRKDSVVIIVGISGASGAIYGLRLLAQLREQGVEIHLILSRSGEKTLFLETGKSAAEVRRLADCSYSVED